MMKPWMIAAALVCFGGSVSAAPLITTQDVASVAISSAGFFSAATSGMTGTFACNGSTFTVTTGAFRLEITLTANLQTSGTGSIKLWVLMDGALIDGFSIAGKAMMKVQGNTSGFESTSTTVYQTASVVSAGAHTFCVGGTETSSSDWGCAAGPCFLRVKEAK